ncbi:hypothetical protein RJ641_024079 [Dillenia turbinata]|uniref:Retrovirus-related Pol polyprotein from transposon TNT 1-94-like beta-barrel domain-containing protein n=1 Tax=Dillenia turbinata TaxID=194707 RepID=A0AAN8YT43_9MAGN
MYISGKDKLGYINGDLPKTPETDPSFCKWRTENAIVKGWLINSIEPSLVGNFIHFSTAKQVWDSIATTYFDGFDSSQVYDLRRRVSRMRQDGGSIEKYYNDLQGLWREIDFRRSNPMQCAMDIQKYNSILQEERVYIFLDGLDDRLDNIRSDVLRLKPFPTIERAYAYVQREGTRQTVMTSSMENASNGAIMATKGVKSNATTQIGTGTDRGKYGQALYISNAANDTDWIIDSGATDHMIFDASDFSKITPPRRKCITNANGAAHPVTGAGVVSMSPSLSLSHTLLVPSLSNKLMSVSQITEELNCVVLMYPKFYLIHDILSKEIVGRELRNGPDREESTSRDNDEQLASGEHATLQFDNEVNATPPLTPVPDGSSPTENIPEYLSEDLNVLRAVLKLLPSTLKSKSIWLRTLEN